MKRLIDNKGYTLLELIIVIGLIAIAASLSGFGLSSLYSSNVNAKLNEVVNEIRLAQSREMASKDKDYEVIISYADNHYSMTTYMQEGANPKVTLKTIELSKKLVLEKDNGAFQAVKDLSIEKRKFVFDASSGKLLTEGSGRYRIGGISSGDNKEFVVIEQNGRVYVDE